MGYLVCDAEDCKQPFEPAQGQEATQKYCSIKCRDRVRQRRHRARLKRKPTGRGPGGGKQPLLFSRSDMRRRKPAKAAMAAKPKQDALFPADISGWFRSLTAEQQQQVRRIALQATGQDGAASDNAERDGEQILCKILPAHLRKPAHSVSVIASFLREAASAA